ncbi:MAG TPA: 3-deoxy-8-phosphooctulonate synthase [Armatimonadetes bacterium]|nr:3-deoxy-8-phosphooctulonate synthase [Armatimonadota bacterium]
MSETVQQIKVGDALIGGPRLALIAGPCLVEDEESTYSMASRLSETCHALDVPFIFKASYDKANRTAVTSARGPGWQKGLQIVARVGRRAGVPVLSDVHEVAQIGVAAEVLDMLQIPAFLCRQTDLLVAAGETGRPINIKKGQFMAPDDMEHSVAKVTSTGNRNVSVTERGSSFGYHNLVVDMRGLQIMRGFGYPVIFDATHSVQLPGGAGGASGGQRDLAPALARAAVAVGIDALFIEVHPDPDNAPCDGPNMLPIDEVGPLLTTLIAIREAVRETAQGG